MNDQNPLDAAYEQGYENGESSANADWYFALTEWGGFDDDFDIVPTKVAQEVARLRDRLKMLERGTQ